MSSPTEVKNYLACWFQLGKAVVLSAPAQEERLRPDPVLGPRHLSPEFEMCWQRILAQPTRCHLEGTDQSVADLLSDAWEICECPRCEMLVPLFRQGPVDGGPCPCADLRTWPSLETIPPRIQPVGDDVALERIRRRLTDSSC